MRWGVSSLKILILNEVEMIAISDAVRWVTQSKREGALRDTRGRVCSPLIH